MTTSTLTAPASDELEITVFGPGFGECILIHIGVNEWIIIDSCLDSRSGRPVALDHLLRIGVDPSDRVKLVLATHWHDDHIGGLSEVFEACRGARFSCSSALTKVEFLELSEILNTKPIYASSSGMTEIQRVFNLVHKRGIRPLYAIADRPIFTKSSAPNCQITALSPSDAEHHRFLQAISALIPTQKATKFRCPDLQPNDVSVATWAKVGATDMLLGADLEEHGSTSRGWSAIIASPNRPSGFAALFKIAHHGSITGHHDGIWTTLLVPGVVAVLTPWNKGRKLPTDADCARIKGLTSNGYLTSRAVVSSLKSTAQAAVARTVRESGIKVRSVDGPTGYVQFRRKLSDQDASWDIRLSSEAISLTS
jgi:hypothetical protein